MTTSLRRMASIESRLANRLSHYVDNQTSASEVIHGLQKPDNKRNNHEDKKTRRKSRCGAKRIEGNLRRHRQTHETAQRYRYRRTFPDETRTARGTGNEEFPPVDERRDRSGHYPFNIMNFKSINTKEIQIMKTKFYWAALLASAAMIAQANAGGRYGGGGGGFVARVAPARAAVPSFNSAASGS